MYAALLASCMPIISTANTSSQHIVTATASSSLSQSLSSSHRHGEGMRCAAATMAKATSRPMVHGDDDQEVTGGRWGYNSANESGNAAKMARGGEEGRGKREVGMWQCQLEEGRGMMGGGSTVAPIGGENEATPVRREDEDAVLARGREKGDGR